MRTLKELMNLDGRTALVTGHVVLEARYVNL